MWYNETFHRDFDYTDINLHTLCPIKTIIIFNQHIVTHTTGPNECTYTFRALSLRHVCAQYPIISLLSAGHACHSKLQTDNSWLFLGQLSVEGPFQLSVALLSALSATAALYCPLHVNALGGFLTHLLLFLLLPLHFLLVYWSSENEGVGPWWEGAGIEVLISGWRWDREVRSDDRGHTELLESLETEEKKLFVKFTSFHVIQRNNLMQYLKATVLKYSFYNCTSIFKIFYRLF